MTQPYRPTILNPFRPGVCWSNDAFFCAETAKEFVIQKKMPHGMAWVTARLWCCPTHLKRLEEYGYECKLVVDDGPVVPVKS